MTIQTKNKSKLNLIIDAVMLLVLMTVAGLGFLIKYVLIPGFKRNELYGSDAELYFLGLTRHNWGDVHFWIGLFFLFLMILHVILHWKMVCLIYKKLIPNNKMRTVLAVIILVLSFFLALAPLFVQPRVDSLIRAHSHSEIGKELNNKSILRISKSDFSTRNDTIVKFSNLDKELELNGSMSLKEVSLKYSIPVEDLAKALDVPLSQMGVRIGRLRKHYSFQMEDVKETVIKLRK